jgi:predicted peroxiredoxin
MSRKVVIFVFNGEQMYFAHALMNALDMDKKGFEVKLVIEGSATRQVVEMADGTKPFANLYRDAKGAGLIDCVCQACSSMSKSLEAAKAQCLRVCGEMGGHPSMARYLEAGFEILVI